MFLILREFREGRLSSEYKAFKYHYLYALRLLTVGSEPIQLQENGQRGRRRFDELYDLLRNPSELRPALKRIESALAGLIDADSSGRQYGGEPQRRSDFTAAIRAEFGGSRPSTGVAQKPRATVTPLVFSTTVQAVGVIKRSGPLFGFIAGENGSDVYFHMSEWTGNSAPRVGMSVTFRPVMSFRGLKAFQVCEAPSAKMPRI